MSNLVDKTANQLSRTLVVIQARMSSTRLPKKVLRPMAGRPMLGLLVDRLGPRLGERLVVVTSVEPSDDAIEQACDQMGVDVLRGDLQDVLSRFTSAVARFSPKTVVRLTGDNPMVDETAVLTALDAWQNRSDQEIAGMSNHLESRTDPYGYSVEIVSADRLVWLSKQRLSSADREHVTKGLIDRGLYGEFQLLDIDASEMRWTVDTPEDFERMDALFDALGPDVSSRAAVDWCRQTRRRTDQ